MAKELNNEIDDLTTYYTQIYNEIDKRNSENPYGKYVLSRVQGGERTVLNKTQTEIRNFDMTFLDAIESVYPAILKIMKDPKKSIRYEEEVVAVEKARKVTAETVRHLSSHTHLIKDIKENGDVIPSKVLTTYAEEEIAIYENRFIKSLVKRMEMFLERRYEVMKVSLESFETQKINVSNKFLMSGQEVNVSIDISIKNDLDTGEEVTKEQFNRLLYIREMVQSLKGTEFMRALSKAREVLPPIMKTNIIMHNPDFKLCYGLWLYLDKVDGIATNVDIKEKSYRFTKELEKDFDDLTCAALATFIKNRNIEGIYAHSHLKTVKANKPKENIENLELTIEPEHKQTEDYSMNEALLSQTAKFFEASMEGMKEAGVIYHESVRTVYKQMLDMLDQIYPHTFGVGDDTLDSKNLYEQLEYARRQQMITKIVRQQKQMNIARMGKEEKRIDKNIKELEAKIEKFEAEQKEAKEKERLENERIKAIEAEKIKKHNDMLKALANEAIEAETKLRASISDEEILSSKDKKAIEAASLINKALLEIKRAGANS